MGRLWLNVLLVAVSVAVCTVAAEFVVRHLDLERLGAFENRAFAKYARVHDLAFIDMARLMPIDPDLYVDAIYNSYAGERLRAWVFLQGLVPIVERHLAWSRMVEPSKKPAPAFKPRPITFACTDLRKGEDAGAAHPGRAGTLHTLVDDRGAEFPQASRRPAITRRRLYGLIASRAQSIYWQICPLTGSRRRQHSTSLSKARPELQKYTSRSFCTQRPPGTAALMS